MIISKKIALALGAAVLCAASVQVAHATVLLGYNVGASAVGVNSFDAGFSAEANAVATGSSLTRTFAPGLADYTATSAWATNSNAPANGNINFSFTSGASTTYSLSSVTFAIQRAAGGSADTQSLSFALFWKDNGSNTVFTQVDLTKTIPSSLTAATEENFDLSSLGTIATNLTVTFKLVVFSTTATTADDFALSNMTDLGVGTGYTGAVVLEGTSASAVPEPSTFALAAGLGILGFVAYRRKRC